MHHLIEKVGAYRAISERFLIEARKPAGNA